jgi:hypothetical protein
MTWETPSGAPPPWANNPAGGIADGVVGHVRRSIQKRRVRLQFFVLDPHGYCWLRVFGLYDTVGGAGVASESKDGISSRGHSAENNGAVGLSDAENKSGVFGFNTIQRGTGYGVFGRCDASDGARVEAESRHGVGVWGHSRLNDAIVGPSDANSKSGVYGFNSSPKGVAMGFFGGADSAGGAGVAGANENGKAGVSEAVKRPCAFNPRAGRARPRQAIA